MKKHMLAKRMGAIALCAVLSTGLLSATAAAQGKDVTALMRFPCFSDPAVP